METKNLGTIQALWIANTPPTNTSMLWLDTSVSPRLHKYYNTLSSTWEPLKSDASLDVYRQGASAISGSTQVDFSSPIASINYLVEVLSYISNTGVKVQSGWTIPEELYTVNNFVFNPPTKYPDGILLFRAILFK